VIAIGIDPGKTIGLCLYDGDRVLAAEQCSSTIEAVQHAMAWWLQYPEAVIALEWPRVYGIGGNDIADTCAQAGYIWGRLGGLGTPAEGVTTGMHALTRGDVVSALSRKMGQQVRGDAGVWAALVELHGGKGIADCKPGKKGNGGPLGLLVGKSHAKAALSVAWAAVDTERRVSVQ
jgi:hypothetical protein